MRCCPPCSSEFSWAQVVLVEVGMQSFSGCPVRNPSFRTLQVAQVGRVVAVRSVAQCRPTSEFCYGQRQLGVGSPQWFGGNHRVAAGVEFFAGAFQELHAGVEPLLSVHAVARLSAVRRSASWMVRLAKLLASSSEPFALSYPIPNFTKSGWAMAALNAPCQRRVPSHTLCSAWDELSRQIPVLDSPKLSSEDSRRCLVRQYVGFCSGTFGSCSALSSVLREALQ